MAWAVYKDPSDYPGKFVVRRFIGMNAKKEPEVVADTLDEARRVIPAGLISTHATLKRKRNCTL